MSAVDANDDLLKTALNQAFDARPWDPTEHESPNESSVDLLENAFASSFRVQDEEGSEDQTAVGSPDMLEAQLSQAFSPSAYEHILEDDLKIAPFDGPSLLETALSSAFARPLVYEFDTVEPGSPNLLETSLSTAFSASTSSSGSESPNILEASFSDAFLSTSQADPDYSQTDDNILEASFSHAFSGSSPRQQLRVEIPPETGSPNLLAAALPDAFSSSSSQPQSEAHGDDDDLLEDSFSRAFSTSSIESESTTVGIEEADDILEAAFPKSFTPPSIHHEPTTTDASSSNSQPTTPATLSLATSVTETASDDSWKTEYESHVESWRTQSAEMREKAEKERIRWEAIRATERADSSFVNQTTGDKWETVREDAGPSSSGAASSSKLPIGVSEPQSTEGSQRWEDVNSLTSSFPSMTFPDQTELPPRYPPGSHSVPLSATLTIFDPSYTTRTRAIAVFSALTINMFLPFVNGVMLGFGEIFAKEYLVGLLGWKPTGPGSSALVAGLGKSKPKKEWEYKKII